MRQIEIAEMMMIVKHYGFSVSINRLKQVRNGCRCRWREMYVYYGEEMGVDGEEILKVMEPAIVIMD